MDNVYIFVHVIFTPIDGVHHGQYQDILKLPYSRDEFSNKPEEEQKEICKKAFNISFVSGAENPVIIDRVVVIGQHDE